MIANARAERAFYGAMVTSIAVVVFVGFSPTFYLRGFESQPKPLTTLLYAHGAVFSAWIVLLLVQASMISTRRVDVHRRLGVLGLALATSMIVLAAATALTLASRLEQNVGAVAAARAALSLFDLPIFALLDLFAVALIAWDFVSRRGVHAATVVGTLALLTDEVAQTLLRDSPAWAKVVARMVA